MTVEPDHRRGGLDVGLLGPGWVAGDVEVDDRALLAAMLEVEVGLAAAQSRMGMVPAWAVEVIRGAARVDDIDLAALSDGVAATANPVVALVSELTARVAETEPAAADHVHRGSTSQDILDTALILLASRAVERIVADLDRTVGHLVALAHQHRDTLCASRTLTQHAVPTTFGLRAAGWSTLVVDAADRLRSVRATLPVSLGGAAGTLAAYEEYAIRAGLAPGASLGLSEALAEELDLVDPVLPWHALRRPMLDLASAASLTTGALGKMASDVLVLTRTEIAEITEPAADGRGASSAMPQKRNPVLCTLIATAARQLPAQALVVVSSMTAEDERSAGGWHAEWQPLRECLRLTAGAAAAAANLTAGLAVYPERMRANLDASVVGTVSERVSAALADQLGKKAAKAAVTRTLASGADDFATTLSGQLDGQVDDPEATARDLLDPSRYLGAAGDLVDRVVAAHQQRSSESR